jgi:hypothetical protein
VGCTARHSDPLQGAAAVDSAAVPALVEAAAPETPLVLQVPHASAPIRPAARFRVRVWEEAVNTHTLLDREGRGAVPTSEARFLWGDGQLYVRFYSGDLDLQVRTTKHDGPVWNDDSVLLAFFDADHTKRVIQISPTGVVADGICPGDARDLGDPRCDLAWESGVRTATDYDGTINKVGDFDEEWSVEAAVPLAAIASSSAGPGTRIAFALSHCEMSYSGPRACGSWGGSGGAGALVLR